MGRAGQPLHERAVGLRRLLRAGMAVRRRASGDEVLVATVFVLAAIAALSYPQLRRLARRRPGGRPRRLVLFVCGGNTGRSPIAAAIARAEVAGWEARAAEGIYATSAGVTVAAPGKPLAPDGCAGRCGSWASGPTRTARSR